MHALATEAAMRKTSAAVRRMLRARLVTSWLRLCGVRVVGGCLRTKVKKNCFDFGSFLVVLDLLAGGKSGRLLGIEPRHCARTERWVPRRSTSDRTGVTSTIVVTHLGKQPDLSQIGAIREAW